jgi:MFS family permease
MPTTTEQPAAPPQEAPQAAQFQHVLKNRNFVLLWLAQLISLTILNAANFGIIVIVNDTTHSVFMSGLAIIAFTIPAVPFSALAGVIVDRLDKRSVLWISNILRALTMLLLVISLLVDRNVLLPLYILIFMTSLIGQFFTPAEGASIPLLVGERDLMPALSLFNITMTLSQAIGFLLLGSLVAKFLPSFTLHAGMLTLAVHSTDMLFVIVMLLYLVCAGLILCIPRRAFHEAHLQNNHVKRESASKEIEALWHEIVDGWHIVRKDSLLFFTVIQLSVVGIIMLLIGELAGPFVQQVLHRPAEDMGIILAPAAIGLVGASILIPHVSKYIGKMRLTVIGFIVLAVGFSLLPFSQWLALRIDPVHGAESALLLWTTVILVFIVGIAMACVNIPTQTTMQERTPEEVRGRVFSLQFMIYNAGSIPVLLFAGAFAQFLGFNQLVFLVSASMLLFCWWGIHYLRADRPNR